MDVITTVADLEALYSKAPLAPAAILKVTRFVTPDYAALIRASPFMVLATSGPEGLDCSPGGDQPGFVQLHDQTRLLIPDRRGDNRVDSLRNIVRDVEEVYFQRARAVVRSKLWDLESRVDPSPVPSPGRLLANLDVALDGEAYDRDWPARARSTLW